MIDTAKLVQLIQNCSMTDAMKKALLPVAQVADEEMKQKIKENIEEYDKKIQAVRDGTFPLTPEAIMYVYEMSKKIEKRKRKQKNLLQEELLRGSQ